MSGIVHVLEGAGMTYRGISEHASYCQGDGNSEVTIKDRREVLMRVESDLGELDHLRSEQLAEWLEREDWSPQTRATYQSHLQSYYRWATKVGRIDIDPTRDLKRPKWQRPRPRTARVADYERVMSKVELRWKIAVALARFAGLGATEIAGLLRGDVDEEHIHIRSNGGRIVVKPMHHAIWQLVRDLPEGHLVLGTNGRPYTASSLSAMFGHRLRQLGIEDLGLAMFRQTYKNIDRLDDTAIAEFLASPSGVAAVYRQNPEAFRNAIEDDTGARDLVAVAYRREQLNKFRRLLRDPKYFTSQRSSLGQVGPERVWQDFLEANSWILGIGAGGQLFTSWNPERLEQTIRGSSILGSGRRTDALMRTAGRIRSLVFAEIKHHQTELLHRVKSPYREDCWAASYELSGGITQIQQTVDTAVHAIVERRIADRDADGNELVGEFTYIVRPRSFLIVGMLDELCGPDGGINRAKYHSFELYRRNLYEPEVLTFDELLARAEWHVTEAEQSSARRRDG